MLPRENRLSKKEFQKLDKNARKFRGEYGMIVLEKYEEKSSKLGFIVNKMTRLLRDIARKHLKNTPNIKGVYVAYKYCDDYEKLEKDFTKHFKDAVKYLKES